MMSLQTKLEELYTPFLLLDCPVSHYRRTAKPPFAVWYETGEDAPFNANNHRSEQQLTGMIDFYTLTEFDPIADDIQEILNDENVGWMLDSVQYEEDTNLIHFQWRWWIG